jgi:gliding motility-associated-like protein
LSTRNRNPQLAIRNRKSPDLNRFKNIIPLLFLATFGSPSLFAAHIIGGEITYECLGNNEYRFTMKVYRDCNGGGACFDSQIDGCTSGATLDGTVTIFNGTSQFEVVQLDAPIVTSIQPNLSNPCLTTPPNVCAEEGVYVFTRNLPSSTQSYTVSYQRCCRNNTITNIVAPGQAGATYTIELIPEAQQSCNNSPVFSDFPPIVICNGVDIDFDHSATDIDGDSLVYQFCTPFLGGGDDTQSFTTLNGVAPDPDAPPPYNALPFLAPTYSFDNPMAGNPQVMIDPMTGLISGVPIATGQFVVGVCVEEYRDGVLISTVRRDFQFNVANCTPTVIADIQETELLNVDNEQVYYVRACGPFGIDFINQSTIVSNINAQEWQFFLPGGSIITRSTFDALNVDFPGEGIYDGFLILNPGLPCNDTARLQVEVFPAITADFEFAYDTCVAGPTQFTDLSFSDAGPNTITDWNWSFGEGGISVEQNPTYIYQVPGNLPVTLMVTDTNDCTNATTQFIEYFPVPSLIVVEPSSFIGCAPGTVVFDNLSFPIDSTYEITWTFGDGNSSGAINPTHVYEDAGVYSISLDIVSPIGCQTDTFWNDFITILPSPVAGFTFTPENPSSIEPTVTFTDQSIDAIKWLWEFGDVGDSQEINPIFTFPDTGMQIIQQVVFHESGCTDTAIVILDIFPEVRYYLPNAFTPNGDGTNDSFFGNGVMEGATNFNLSIWNRYGEKLFETEDFREGWNGRKDNIGRKSEQGVYVVVVTFTGPRGESFNLKGYATLIR